MNPLSRITSLIQDLVYFKQYHTIYITECNFPIDYLISDRDNRYVTVTFDPITKRVQCLFHNGNRLSKLCTVNVSYGVDCDQELGTYPNSSFNNFVVTPQIEFVNGIFEYCLLVTAISGNTTVKVEGRVIDIDTRQNNAALITSLIFLIIIIVAMAMPIAIWKVNKDLIPRERYIKFNLTSKDNTSPMTFTEALKIFSVSIIIHSKDKPEF